MPSSTRHGQRWARCIGVGVAMPSASTLGLPYCHWLATSSTPTLRSLCCRWACLIIHINIALTVLSFALPVLSFALAVLSFALAVLLLGLPHHPCWGCSHCVWRCACMSSLGLPRHPSDFHIDIGLCPGRGQGKGVSHSGERKCKHTYLIGLPQCGSPLAFSYPSAPAEDPSMMVNGSLHPSLEGRGLLCCWEWRQVWGT